MSPGSLPLILVFDKLDLHPKLPLVLEHLREAGPGQEGEGAVWPGRSCLP